MIETVDVERCSSMPGEFRARGENRISRDISKVRQSAHSRVLLSRIVLGETLN